MKKTEAGVEGTGFRFERSFNRKAAGENQDTMRFEITLARRETGGGVVRRLTLARAVKIRPQSGPGWNSTASEPGRATEKEEEGIQRLRDSFVPRHLGQFFLLNAERSQSLELGQEAAVEGVSRVLGLWGFGELEKQLRQVTHRSIPKEYRCTSAAEATAWLAQLVPPLLVDTPLARLDAEVRESVLRRLYLMGHQTILLTTNAEIGPEGPLFEG